MKRTVLALLLALWARPASAAEPCQVRVGLDPPRAVVGQQVIHSVELLRREDVEMLRWEETRRYPGMRAEPLDGDPSGEPLVRDGSRYLRFEERTALFPARRGRLTLPPARLSCVSGTTRPLVVPATVLEVLPPPEAGRTPEWTGLVGKVAVSARLARQEITLGESVRLTVELSGAANLWDAAVLPDAGPAVELFPRPPGLEFDRGARLRVWRRDEFDLVPRVAGTLVIQPVRIPYLDPENGRYLVARSEPIPLRVRTR